jgi:hypothetical protein
MSTDTRTRSPDQSQSLHTWWYSCWYIISLSARPCAVPSQLGLPDMATAGESLPAGQVVEYPCVPSKRKLSRLVNIISSLYSWSLPCLWKGAPTAVSFRRPCALLLLHAGNFLLWNSQRCNPNACVVRMKRENNFQVHYIVFIYL